MPVMGSMPTVDATLEHAEIAAAAPRAREKEAASRGRGLARTDRWPALSTKLRGNAWIFQVRASGRETAFDIGKWCGAWCNPMEPMKGTLNGVHAFAASLQPAGGGGSSPDAGRLDPVQLVLHASLPVKAVLVILVVFSLACWVVIGAKYLHLRRARGESERFLKTFDAASSFDAVAQGLAAFRGSPFARIFAIVCDEMMRMTGRPSGAPGTRRARTWGRRREGPPREVTHLESWMSLLGTTARRHPSSVFGTVYGIMDAFQYREPAERQPAGRRRDRRGAHRDRHRPRRSHRASWRTTTRASCRSWPTMEGFAADGPPARSRGSDRWAWAEAEEVGEVAASEV